MTTKIAIVFFMLSCIGLIMTYVNRKNFYK